MYEVIHFFTDLNDDNHAYHTGDKFPRDGVKVSDDRIKELSGNKNKLGVALIKAIGTKAEAKTEEEPKVEVKPRRGRRKVDTDD